LPLAAVWSHPDHRNQAFLFDDSPNSTSFPENKKTPEGFPRPTGAAHNLAAMGAFKRSFFADSVVIGLWVGVV